MPDESVVNVQPTNEPEPTIVDPKGQEPEPTPKPAEPIEHPEFQKRINEFVGQINHLKRQLNQQNQTREADQSTIKAIAKQNKELAELLEKVDDKVSSSTGPSFDDDPQGYIDRRFNRILGKLEKIAKPANEIPETQTQPGVPDLDATTITAQREAQAALHDDYYKIFKDTEADMRIDPALANTIMESPNPPKAAYDYGVRKRKLAEQTRQGTLRQGYVEGGAPPPSKQDINSLTAEEKNLAGKLELGDTQAASEAKFLTRKQLIAKRRG